jgi:O-antigen ligase
MPITMHSPPGRRRAEGPPQKKPARPPVTRLIWVFLAGHVVLAIAMRVAPSLATAHAFACVALGLVTAAVRKPRDVVIMMAYITGAEVLWRMTRAGTPYELAKYAVTAMAMISLVRIRWPRNRVLALLYLGLMLPSVALTLSTIPGTEGRQLLSSNMSGPLSMAFCLLFFSNVRLTAADLRATFFALIAPATGMATLVFVATSSMRDVDFGTNSNRAASGGFGPNQVAAVIGLALLFALLMLFEKKVRWRQRLPLIGLATFLAVQAALTFSRGGLVAAFCGALVAMLYLVRDARTRVTLFSVALVFIVVGKFFVVPQLDKFTHGKLVDRYSNLESTGRTELANLDLEIFREHPLAGVGPGVANQLREEMGREGAAHTEYTRMLAEHGMFGLLAMLVLFAIAIRTFQRARALEARAFVGALFVWSALFMLINAMRLVAPAFVAGLACAISLSSIPLPTRSRAP